MWESCKKALEARRMRLLPTGRADPGTHHWSSKRDLHEAEIELRRRFHVSVWSGHCDGLAIPFDGLDRALHGEDQFGGQERERREKLGPNTGVRPDGTGATRADAEEPRCSSSDREHDNTRGTVPSVDTAPAGNRGGVRRSHLKALSCSWRLHRVGVR